MDEAAVDTLRALGLLARRPLTGCSLPPRRRIFVPSGGHDKAQSYANPGFRAMADRWKVPAREFEAVSDARLMASSGHQSSQ
jgi:hypothetical protein